MIIGTIAFSHFLTLKQQWNHPYSLFTLQWIDPIRNASNNSTAVPTSLGRPIYSGLPPLIVFTFTSPSPLQHVIRPATIYR